MVNWSLHQLNKNIIEQVTIVSHYNWAICWLNIEQVGIDQIPGEHEIFHQRHNWTNTNCTLNKIRLNNLFSCLLFSFHLFNWSSEGLEEFYYILLNLWLGSIVVWIRDGSRQGLEEFYYILLNLWLGSGVEVA